MAELDGKQLDTQHSLDLQETAINQGKDDFMERIRAMYVAGGADSYTNVLINSSDFYDILMRIELVTRVAKHDNDELNELLDQYKKLEKTKAELDEQIKQLKAKAEEYAKEQKTLAGEQAELLKMEQESGKLIEQIKNDKSDLEISHSRWTISIRRCPQRRIPPRLRPPPRKRLPPPKRVATAVKRPLPRRSRLRRKSLTKLRFRLPQLRRKQLSQSLKQAKRPLPQQQQRLHLSLIIQTVLK